MVVDATGLVAFVTVKNGRELRFINQLTVWPLTPAILEDRAGKMLSGCMLSIEYMGTPPWVIGAGSEWTWSPALYDKHFEKWEKRRVSR